jgi:quercetin dioxygenase-like cupin family protein
MKRDIIHVGQIGIHFLLESAETNGAVAMFEFTVPAGAKVPLPHSHQHYDETIYGVEGVVTFIVEGKAVDIGPGQSCFIPRGAVHGFLAVVTVSGGRTSEAPSTAQDTDWWRR